MSGSRFTIDVAVVGGCGHVGLPLGLAFADRGLDVTLFDVNADRGRPGERRDPAVRRARRGRGARARCSARVGLRATTDPALVARAEHVVVVIGTPIDEHLNPDLNAVPARHRRASPTTSATASSSCCAAPCTRASPRMVEQLVARLGLDVDVAFCPERIAEGKAMVELCELPQIVAARTERALERADEAVPQPHRRRSSYLEPEEAELAKLFTNTWRYIKFAAANQLFMMANDFGLDYERIRAALAYDYPRAADLPARRVRRRPVPVQGHDAARGVQQQQLPRSARRA